MKEPQYITRSFLLTQSENTPLLKDIWSVSILTNNGKYSKLPEENLRKFSGCKHFEQKYNFRK